jgi:hypothetical protein
MLYRLPRHHQQLQRGGESARESEKPAFGNKHELKKCYPKKETVKN